MITIPSEYLNNNWKKLVDTKILPITLSEWDDGDVYSLSSMGACPSRKEVYGAVVIGESDIREYQIVIQLIKVSDEQPFDYASPTGEKFKAVSYSNAVNAKNEKIVTHIVDVGYEISSRHRGLIETDLLRNSSVLIFGLGTGGIQIAINLAKCGVGNFHLVDPDRLEIGNICRHQAGISQIGRKKVLVAKDLLLEKNPNIKVHTYPIKADETTKDEIQEIIKGVDLIICATDNRESKLLINAIDINLRKPIFFSGAFRRAYGGQILRVYPAETACYHCFLLGMPDIETDQEISSAANADEIAYSDMPVPIEPGLALDVEPIGTMTSKLALQELLKGKDSTLHVLDKDFSANWYFWINRPEPGTKYSAFPPLSESSDEMTILRWYGVFFDKDEACPTCGNFEKALREQYGLELNENAQPESSSLPPDIKL
jgi:molybdopterin/thiamine biosynthesis adenylyltransferase